MLILERRGALLSWFVLQIFISLIKIDKSLNPNAGNLQLEQKAQDFEQNPTHGLQNTSSTKHILHDA